MASKKAIKPQKLKDKDIKELQQLIKKIWKDYSVTPECLISLPLGFVNQFYKKCLNELESDCYDIMRIIYDVRLGEISNYCLQKIHEELFLYLHVHYVLKQINVTYVTLTDFYKPSNRTRLTMRIVLNFLAFSKNRYDEFSSLVKSVKDEIETCFEELKQEDELKERLVSVNNEVGEISEDIIKLEKELKSIENDEINFEKKRIEELEEIERLESIIESFKVSLNNINEQNEVVLKNIPKLKEKIITEKDYEEKIENIKFNKNHLDTLNKTIAEQHNLIEEKCNNLQHLQMLLTLCESIDLNSLKEIDKYIEDKRRLERKDLSQSNVKNNIKHLENEVESMKNQVKIYNGEIEGKEKFYKDLLKKVKKEFGKSESESEKLKEEFENLNVTVDDLKVEIDGLKGDLKEIQSVIDKSVEGYNETYSFMIGQYQIIRDSDLYQVDIYEKIAKNCQKY